MSGRVGDLSADQAAKLQQFKESLKDVSKDTYTDQHYLRFLRGLFIMSQIPKPKAVVLPDKDLFLTARNFNLKKSEDMFRKYVEWRSKHKMSTILEDHPLPEAMAKYWPRGDCGIDKEGHVVEIMNIGRVDVRGIMYSLKSSDREIVGLNIMEFLYAKAKRNSEKQGRYIEGITFIMDMEGLGVHILWKPFIALFNEMMVIMEQYYPETVHKVFITRPPAMFPLAYSLVRPFLDEATKKKIKVLKSGSKWKETLLKYIDEDQLPKHWGGSMVDPDGDPKCPSKIGPAGKVPESYYMKDVLFEEDAMTKIVINSGGTKMLKYEVRVPESAVRYVFKTDEGEIKFSIYKKTKGSDEKVFIKEEAKYNCHVIPVDGEVEAKELGFYVFCFENPSKIKSKTLSYQIEVIEADDESLETVELSGED